MKTTLTLLTSFSLLFFISMPVFAQTPVIDVKTAEQAMLNGTSAEAQENLIEKEFDAMQKAQSKVQAMILVVERHLDKVEKIQKDIIAFRKEGAAIKLFVFKTKKAMQALDELAGDFTGHNNTGSIRELGILGSYRVIFDLSTDIYGICRDMVSTVIDAKFALPGLSQPKPSEQINLLEPQERLAFYERCSYEMEIITFKIQQMHYEIITSDSFKDAFVKLAPESYWNMEFAKIIADDIVGLWKD